MQLVAGLGAVSGHLHPDERFLIQMADGTRGPSSILNYFDTDTSRLNPYNIKNPDYARFIPGLQPAMRFCQSAMDFAQAPQSSSASRRTGCSSS